MSEHTSFDFGSAVAVFVIVVVAIMVAIRLVPAVLALAWQLLPAVLLIWFIVAVLRALVRKLLD